jgi:heme/copper-type cytochrome/quinol oxidase subunit 2
MSSRSWFYASEGKQQGPYPEIQLRELAARGTVTPDTLVWCEGMAGWQKASEIPGLLGGHSGPPAVPPSGGFAPGGAVASPGYAGTGYGGSTLSLDLGIWEFTWRSLVLLLGLIFIIPTPWVVCWYLNWFVSRVQVPGRPNLSFTGKPLVIAAWYFGTIIVAIALSLTDISGLSNLGGLLQIVLYWLFLRYLVANIASNGQPLGLSFSGSFWAYLGWSILLVLSVITIIGWAWVYAAQMRWVCRNIQGTRREVVFKGTGLEYLWRLIVVALASAFVIPIPWMFRWMMRWQLSQTELVERGAYANA